MATYSVYFAGESARHPSRFLGEWNCHMHTCASSGRHSALDRALLPVLLLALLLGAGLRFWQLDAESFWLDEVTSILLARSDIPTLIRATAQDIHPPVYYVLLHLWLRLGEGEFMARALSALVGVISIALIYRLGASLFGNGAGATSALLLAASPLHIWYAQETRMYILVTLWTLAGSYWLWRALQRGRWWQWLAYALCMALGLYTHYHAIFVLLFQNLFVAFCWLCSHDRRQLARIWLLADAVIALLFLPWLPVLVHQVAQGGGGWVEKAIGHPGPRVLVETWIDYSVGSARQWYPLWLRRAGYLLFALAAVWPFATAAARWQRKVKADWLPLLYATMYLVVPLLAVWTISQVKPMYAGRYLLPFLPPYLLLLGYGVTQLPWKIARLSLLIGLMAVSLVGAGLAASRLQKDDWRGVAAWIATAAQPGDVVLCEPVWNYKPFEYYAGGRVATYHDWPVSIATDDDLGALLQPAVAGRTHLWLIWMPKHYSDPQGILQSYLDDRHNLLVRREVPGIGLVSLYALDATR